MAWSQQARPSTRRSGSQLSVSSARPAWTARSMASARCGSDPAGGDVGDCASADGDVGDSDVAGSDPAGCGVGECAPADGGPGGSDAGGSDLAGGEMGDCAPADGDAGGSDAGGSDLAGSEPAGGDMGDCASADGDLGGSDLGGGGVVIGELLSDARCRIHGRRVGRVHGVSRRFTRSLEPR